MYIYIFIYACIYSEKYSNSKCIGLHSVLCSTEKVRQSFPGRFSRLTFMNVHENAWYRVAHTYTHTRKHTQKTKLHSEQFFYFLSFLSQRKQRPSGLYPWLLDRTVASLRVNPEVRAEHSALLHVSPVVFWGNAQQAPRRTSFSRETSEVKQRRAFSRSFPIGVSRSPLLPVLLLPLPVTPHAWHVKAVFSSPGFQQAVQFCLCAPLLSPRPRPSRCLSPLSPVRAAWGLTSNPRRKTLPVEVALWTALGLWHFDGCSFGGLHSRLTKEYTLETMV